MKIKDRAKPKLPPVDPGVYTSICVGVIDLGEQYSDKFKNYTNKLMLVWELCGVTVDIDGEQKPRQLSKEFTFSASKKGNLRAFVESWQTKTYSDDDFSNFDVFDLLGKACLLSVALNETGEYANITGVMALPNGMPEPKTETVPIGWDMEAWNDDVFATIPEWIQDKIKHSTQYMEAHTPTNEIKAEPSEQAAKAAQAATVDASATVDNFKTVEKMEVPF